ncbi:MAG: hypothetical protein GIW95_05700 [Candidatus Eremiobacteraeota bacterium]|nr:hypothetical protein [Candidatus Eremiobacteraeota bacterium]
MIARQQATRPLVRTIAEVEAALYERMIDEADLHFRARQPVLGAPRRALASALSRLAGAIAP